MRDVAIVAARRTPIGTAGHGLASCTAADLAAAVLPPVLSDADLSADEVADVVLGNCTGPGGDVARVAALSAGLPSEVPALTVDRQCASGLAAVDLAAAVLRSTRGVVLAGGVESASTAPLRFWPGEPPVRYTRAPFAPADAGDPDMGPAADLLAEKAGVGRERQDAYAARSHARAVATRDAGGFDAETVPLGAVRGDERPRAGLGVERLARLCAWLRPHAICFVGLAGWRAAIDRKATVGWQPGDLGGVPVYVMPSTSGLNARIPRDELAAHLRAAAAGPADPVAGPTAR